MNPIWSLRIFFFSFLVLFFGCSSSTPSGPKVAVMPGPNKPYEVFLGEHHFCREFALQSIGKSPKKTSANSIDTATAENATGAAAGPIAEGPMAKATGEMSKVEYKGRDLQWSYDMAYTQCMYAKGNRVPGYPIRPEVAPPREAPKK
ncbi:MAG: hypothetical protein ACXVLQ_06200 [Bacteriovorax sp.]